MGIEPATPCLQSRCSSQLSYSPMMDGRVTNRWYYLTMKSERVSLLASVGFRRLPLWLLILVVTWQPWPKEVANTIPSDLGDGVLVAWALKWNVHALTSDPWALFDANIFHPQPDALMWSDPMTSLAPLFGLFDWLTGNPIAALNLVMMSMFVLSLVAGHALGMRLFDRSDAALIFAVVASCNSYVFGQTNHPQLQTVGLVTLVFLLLFRGLEHRRGRDGVALGLAFTALTVASAYYGLAWSVGALAALATLGLRRALPPLRSLTRVTGAALVTGAVLLAPFIVTWSRVETAQNVTRQYSVGNSLYPTDFLTPQSSNWLWWDRLAGVTHLWSKPEHTYFPGFLVIVAGLLGTFLLVRAARRPHDPIRTSTRFDEIVALAAAGTATLVLALGPEPFGVKGPFVVFHRFVPGFDAVRVTARFTVVTFIAGAALTTLAYVVLANRRPSTSSRGRAWLLAPYLFAAVVILETAGPLGRVPIPPAADRAVYTQLAAMEPGPVVELPFTDPTFGHDWAFTEAPRMLNSTIDWNPRVNGYSAQAPPGFHDLADVLDTWPSAPAAVRLADLEVRYVIVHGGAESTVAELSFADLESIGQAAQDAGYQVERIVDDLLVTLDG